MSDVSYPTQKDWKALKFSCWSWAFMKQFAIGHVVNGWNLSWLQLWTKHGCEYSWIWSAAAVWLIQAFVSLFCFFAGCCYSLIPITTGHEDPQILRTSCRCLGWWNPVQAWWLFSILVHSLDSLDYIIWDSKLYSPVGGKTIWTFSFLGPCQYFFGIFNGWFTKWLSRPKVDTCREGWRICLVWSRSDATLSALWF